MTQWLQNRFGEHWLASINGKAFLSQSSDVVFEPLFAPLFRKKAHLYIIVGSDSGLLARYAAKHFCGGNRRFIFVEPDRHFDLLKAEGALPDTSCIEVFPQKDFSFETLDEKYPEYITHNRYTLVRSLAILDQVDPIYINLWDDLTSQYKLFQFHQASLRSNRNFINKQLLNVAFNEVPAGKLEGCLKDKSVLLLGGGPTLDDGIEWIKAHRDQIIIAAVGRIAHRLQKEGIEPDFYASVDPNDVSYDNSKWLLKSDQATLLHTPYTHSSLLGEFTGLQAFTDARYPWESGENPLNIATPGPTVTNTLLSLLVIMEARHIYLLGVDMCYGASGETHESGSFEAKHGKLTHSIDLQVETYSGRRAITNSVFYDGLKALNQYAGLVHEKTNQRIYQLGHESAKAENIPLVTFEEITLLEPNERHQLHETLRQNLHSTPDQRRELQTKRRHFREVLDLATEGRETADKLFKNYELLDKQTQKITKIQNKLKSDKYHWMQVFLYQYAVGNYAKFLSPERSDSPEDHDEIRANLLNYFSALEKTAQDLLEVLEARLERIRVEIKALSRQNLAEVAQYWLAEQMEGRIRLWLEWHGLSQSALNDEEARWVDKLLTAFEHKLNDTVQTKLVQKLKKESEQLNTHLMAAQNYFETRNMDALKELQQALSAMNGERAASLYALVSGYLSELSGEPRETALNHYLKITDHQIALPSLNRVVQLSFDAGDLPTAMEALGMLAQYNDRYLIMYADLLAAQGDVAGAIQLYDHYLSRHLDDHAVWLKAAKAAMAGKDWDAAEQCLNEVESKSDIEALRTEAQQLKKVLAQLKTEHG